MEEKPKVHMGSGSWVYQVIDVALCGARRAPGVKIVARGKWVTCPTCIEKHRENVARYKGTVDPHRFGEMAAKRKAASLSYEERRTRR